MRGWRSCKVGRDKLDEIQGVKQKILAIEAFLQESRIPTKGIPSFYYHRKLTRSRSRSSRLQSKWPNRTSWRGAFLTFNSRFSTWRISPWCFYIPRIWRLASIWRFWLSLMRSWCLREGMALRTHEFVKCQEERHKPLILSKVSRVSSVHSRRLTWGKLCRFV